MKKISRRNFLEISGMSAIAAGLAACGASSSTATEGTATGGASTATDAKPENMETVIWYISSATQEDQPLVMEKVNEYLAEKAGINMDLRCIDDGEYNDKMKLMSMSGEEYDLCYTCNWKNKFTENMAREGFLALDDLIEEYGQDMKATLPEACFNAGMMEGQRYAVAHYQLEANTAAFFIRHDLVEKYGWDLSKITTYADIEPFAQELVGGDDGLVAPMYTNQDIGQFIELNGHKAYEFMMGQNGIIMDRGDETLTVKNQFEGDCFKDFCNIQRDFYNKGFFQEDIVTCDFASLRLQASYGIIFAPWNPTAAATTEAAYGALYDVVQVGEPYVSSNFGQSSMTAVNVGSTRPEASVKLMNLVHSDEKLYNMLVYGLEGVHYDMEGDRIKQRADSKYNLLSRSWMIGNTLLRASHVDDTDDWREVSNEIMQSAPTSPASGFAFNSNDYQAELAQYESVFKEYQFRWFIEDYDDFVPEFLDKLEAGGINVLIDAMQAQLEEFKAL